MNYSSGYNVPAPSYYYPSVKNDEQIKSFAKEQTDGVYNTYIDSLGKAKDHNVSLIEDAMKQIEPLYEERIADLRGAYEYKGQQLSDYANSRGMGRSSYALDMQNRNLSDLGKAENKVQQEKLKDINGLNREILTLKMEYENNKVNLTAQKDAEYRMMIYELEKERNSTLWEAQKYNQQLWSDYQDRVMDERKYQLDVQKYNLDVQEYQLNILKYQAQMQAAKSSGGSRSGGGRSSGGGGSVSVDHARIAQTWNGLSFSQKITYFEKNGASLKKASPNLYAQMYKEYSAISSARSSVGMAKDVYNSIR